ncbi:MAG: FAD-binding oxidoreductase [Gemmatimonadetes bacterium]|nr:FAD-binding oxidoreductase [Gemmatimonadota bacterium]
MMESLATILPASAMAEEPKDMPDADLPGSRRPDAVVRPGATEDVAALMEWATREGVGVLPIGSGRRAHPVRGDGRFVVLRTDGLAGLETYEAADLTLSAGAGTPFGTVAAALAENAQWAPFDPPRIDQRSLGGLVANGLSGPLHMGYGELRNHVLGLTVVTGDGRTLRLGGRVVKNVAGFDLLKAVVGSRGSLAIITSVVLRAFPVPPVDRTLYVEGATVGELLKHALEVGTAPVLPASSVIVDALAAAGGRPALVVRLHGAEATVAADQRRLEEHVGLTFRVDSGVDHAGVRDHASLGDVLLAASARPSRLGAVLDALDALTPTALSVDSYGGRVRAASAVPTGEVIDSVRSRIEDVGGALRLFAPSMDGRAAELSTRPRPGEQALVEGLRSAFDPGGVLWPARF